MQGRHEGNLMKAYWMHAQSGESALELRDAPRPVPEAGQVLVRVRAAGLNRGEFIHGHSSPGVAGSARPVGNEAAGEVVALGSGVRVVKGGGRIMGRRPGAFAAYGRM